MTTGSVEHGRSDALRNRAALLDAAADVLATDPAASLADVASRAGLGRATLYRHFTSREALQAAIREEALTRAASALEDAALDTYPPREAVRRAASALVPLGMRFRILLVEGADNDPEFIAAREQALRPLWAVLERGQERGDLDPATPREWVAMTLASLLVTAVRAASAGLVPVDQAGGLVSRALFDGMGTR